MPRGSGVPPRCGAAVTSNAAAARPAPSRRDAAPTESLRDVHGTTPTSSGRNDDDSLATVTEPNIPSQNVQLPDDSETGDDRGIEDNGHGSVRWAASIAIGRDNRT